MLFGYIDLKKEETEMILRFKIEIDAKGSPSDPNRNFSLFTFHSSLFPSRENL